jgi:hypothetical protein
MSDTKDLKLVFTGVAVRDSGLALVTTVRGDVPDDEEVNHELVYLYEDEDWSAYDAEDLNIVGGTFNEADDSILLYSPDGLVRRLFADHTRRESIDDSDDGPSDLVQIRRIIRSGDTDIAVGMARRAYVHQGVAGKWTPIDSGCFVPRGQRKAAIGFNDVCAWSPSELLAVGYKGEVWSHRNGAWDQLPSPTNVTLNGVACAPSEWTFVAVGLAGTLVSGVNGTLKAIDTGLGNLWSAIWFNGHFYVAGDAAIYRVVGTALDQVEEVALSQKKPPTTGYLAAGGGVMWSVGEHDIFSTSDGSKWKRIPNP